MSPKRSTSSKTEGVTHLGGVPSIMRSLLDAGLTNKDCDFQRISYGGAPSGPTLIQNIAADLQRLHSVRRRTE